ncbi:MAG: helix-hairpin-helix domain-containing protein [Promethearchaeota archaeon]|jgi:predicted flap endonuclease-1-like 5' DNA nuclease
MGNKIELIATVKTPSKKSFLRKGEGYSLKEIQEAGRTINQLKELNIKIDYFRKSFYPENIDKLKTLKISEKKEKKRKSFVKKEKKRTAFKSIKKKAITKPKKIVAEVPKKPIAKKKVEVAKKEKIKPTKKEKAKIEEKGRVLTDLSGLGTATAKKFAELGVESIEDLIKEKPEELSSLIKGVSSERVEKWIEEGRELLKQ